MDKTDAAEPRLNGETEETQGEEIPAAEVTATEPEIPVSEEKTEE